MNLLSIVIPVFNLWPYTKACLESIAAHSSRPYLRVCVVDNGSTDETPREAAELGRSLFGERFSYLRLTENLGFGPACNAGAAQADSTYVLFLNNDVVALEGWLEPLLLAVREPRVGAVSPLLLFPENRRVQHAGVAFTPDLQATHLYFNFPGDHPVVSKHRRLQALSGAALLLPSSLFQQVGGFHAGYRNGSEDIDLSCRLRRAGLRLELRADSVLLHHTSMTPGRYDDSAANSRLLNERCRGCFAMDLHRLAARDGFELRLNDWLQPMIRLPVRREAELDATLPSLGRDPAGLEETLAQEPLWQAGYAPLREAMEARGDLPGAAFWAGLEAFFFPSLENHAQAARLHALAGNAREADQWSAHRRTAQGKLADADGLRARAERTMTWVRASGHSSLAQMYEQWLQERRSA